MKWYLIVIFIRIQFGVYCHLYNIMSLINEHRVSLHLFRSFISLNNGWKFLVLYSFVKSFPLYFILLNIVVNEIFPDLRRKVFRILSLV